MKEESVRELLDLIREAATLLTQDKASCISVETLKILRNAEKKLSNELLAVWNTPTPEPPVQPQFSQAGIKPGNVRDRLWLAGMAMQGLLACSGLSYGPESTAESAGTRADAMLDWLAANPRPE